MKYPILYILLLFLTSLLNVFANTDFNDCYNRLHNGDFGLDGAVDINGNKVTNISQAVGLTYEACKTYCGPGIEAFVWRDFSSQFTAWLLPWLAIISQLPYGANDALSNFESMVLTVGSPMLAGYSLALAVASNRWMIKRFRRSTHRNSFYAAKILRNLQQVSFKIPLEVSPNGDWWSNLDRELNSYSSPRWTLAAIVSISYVLLAYIFTWVDTLTGGLPRNAFGSGECTSYIWLSLFPIVTCNLQLSPKSDPERTRECVDRVNTSLIVTGDNRTEPKQTTSSRGIIVTADNRTEPKQTTSSRGIIATGDRDNRTEPEQTTSSHAIVTGDNRTEPEQTTSSRASGIIDTGDNRTEPEQTTNARCITDAGDNRIEQTTRSCGIIVEIAPDESEYEDQICPTPICFYARVFNWVQTVQRVVAAFDPSSRKRSNFYEIFRIYLTSAFLAVLLQWGTTCAAIMAIYLTPTRGFGCRSGSFLLYGILSMTVWVLFVISSILAHSFSKLPEGGRSRKVIGALVIFFRQAGKILAGLNTVWILTASLFQYSNVFDNCYCNASVLGLGSKAYAVLYLTPEDQKLTRGYWFAGMGMASGTVFIFIVAINLLLKSPEQRSSFE